MGFGYKCDRCGEFSETNDNAIPNNGNTNIKDPKEELYVTLTLCDDCRGNLLTWVKKDN